ncbi:cytochrome P450 [Longispora urticae]
MVNRVDLSMLEDPSVRRDPYPVWAALRENSPLFVADGDAVIVAKHQHCSQILRDPNVSSNRAGSRLAARCPEVGRPRSGLSFLAMDPPDHTRLRRLVSAVFTPRAIAQLEPRIRSITDQLLAGLPLEGGTAELISLVAHPLPVRVICELLGVPIADREAFKDWSDRVVHALDAKIDTFDGAAIADGETAFDELTAYFQRLVAQRRKHPADDLLTALIAEGDASGALTESELLSVCILLLIAGHETTTGLIGNGVLALLQHLHQWRKLAENPDLASEAVEEVLRYDPPVQVSGRVARGSMRLGGLEISDGTVLKLLLGATGRDPAAFQDPDRFDITRPTPRHLAFMAGPHFCLGAGLARLEARVVLETLTRRLRGARLVEQTLTYTANTVIRSPARLEFEFGSYAPTGIN